jgi:hypothetical protein
MQLASQLPRVALAFIPSLSKIRLERFGSVMVFTGRAFGKCVGVVELAHGSPVNSQPTSNLAYGHPLSGKLLYPSVTIKTAIATRRQFCLGGGVGIR